MCWSHGSLFPFYICHKVFYVVLCMCWSHGSLFHSSFPHPEKNLVHPESSLPRWNTLSLLLRSQDRVQTHVDVLLLPCNIFLKSIHMPRLNASHHFVLSYPNIAIGPFLWPKHQQLSQAHTEKLFSSLKKCIQAV